MFDLFCLGGAAVDLVLQVLRLPESDEKMAAHFAGRVPGGLVGNTACAAARLGLRVGWSGLLGADEAAREVRDDFRRFGVDSSLAVVQPERPTDFTVILLEPGGARTILVVTTLQGPPPLTGGVLDALRASRFGYALPRPPDWFEPFAAAVHSGGGRVVVDLESTAPVSGGGLRAALRQTDIAFCGQGGLELATGRAAVEDGVQALFDLGVQLVVVTLGARGAAAYTPGGAFSAPAYTVPDVVDTTGAGDCFHAAFLASLLEARPLDEALRFANAAAALSVRGMGARGGLPDRGEVLALIETGSTG